MNRPQTLAFLKNVLYLVKHGKSTAAERMLQAEIDKMSQQKFEKKMLQGGLANPR